MKLPVTIEYSQQRVLTTAQVAESYKTDSKVISNNFTRNKSRYTEGKHYYCLTGSKKREFCNRHQIEDGSKASVLYLWTEKGMLLHAKSLNNDKAWEAYDFLIDHYFKTQQMPTMLDSYMINDPVKRAERWIEEQKERQALETTVAVQNERIEEMRPKEIFADALTTSDKSILVGDLAKILKQNGVDTGQKRLFAWLRENGYLMKYGASYNLPTQRSMELGLFETKETPVIHADGHITVSFTVKVTGKGQQDFINKFLGVEVVRI